MPLRGESIGTAYVRVLADATGFPDSLRDEIDREEPGIKRQGRHTAQAFEEGFREEMEKADDLSLREVLNRALGSNQATQEFFSGNEWARFKSRMKTEFGSVGELAAHELEEKFVNSGSVRGLDTEVENIIRRVSATTNRINQVQSEEARASQKAMTDFETEFRRVMNETSEVSKKVSTDNVNNLERTRRTFESLRSTVGKLHIEIDKSGDSFVSAFTKMRAGERDARTATTTMGRLGQVIDHVADGTGRAFGKGSRNDFLNFTGSFVANSLKMLSLGPKIADNIGQFAIGFSDAFTESGKFFSSMRAGFSAMAADAEGGSTALAAAFSNIAVTIPVLIAAFAGMVVILGIVSSLVSGLAAAIIALAGSLAFALAGAIAPLVGLLGPLPIIIGAIVAGVISMRTHTKELTQIVTPLVNTFKDLGVSAKEGFLQTFNLKNGVDGLTQSMKLLHPAFEAVGEGVGVFADRLSHIGDSPTFRRFISQMTDFLPTVMNRLTSIAFNLGKAMTNIFIDLIPVTRDFLKWLDQITANFAEWTGSASGRKEIQSFLHDAADSAQSVGHFLEQAVQLLGTLLQGGKKSGDTIFDDLADKLHQFDQFLTDHPDGMADFFKNGVEVARQIGNIALALGEIFDALDDPDSRKALQEILSLMTTLSKLAGPIAAVSDATFGLISQFALVGKAIGDLVVGPAKIGNMLENIGKKIRGFFSGFSGPGGGTVLAVRPPNLSWIPNASKRIGGFLSGITHAARLVEFSAIASKARSVMNTLQNVIGNVSFSSLASKARNAATAIMGAIGRVSFSSLIVKARNAASTIGSIFGQIPGRLANLASAIGNAASSWGAAILNRITAVPGQIVHIFSGLGARISDAIGSVNIHVNLPNLPNLPGIHNPFTASGGVFDGAAWRIIGEAGPEAVVPLTGPLDQVDPAVRWLAAMARGMTPTTSAGSSPTGPSKTINNEWHITPQTTDVVGVAREMVNAMVATGY